MPIQIDDTDVDDRALEALLKRVYVDAGFTDAAVAEQMFAADAVRARGTLLTVTAPAMNALIGMVIVVSPGSPAHRIAGPGEAEMHLLAVSPEHRNTGAGRQLVDAAVQVARSKGLANMVLWTQTTMLDAQRLYLRAGFSRSPQRDFERAGRAFLVYEMALAQGLPR